LPFNVVVEGPYGVVPIDLKKKEDGTYVAKYDPQDPGKYHIEVTLNDAPVDHSPYTVNIDRSMDESDPTKSWIDGPGIEPGNKNTKPTFFYYSFCR